MFTVLSLTTAAVFFLSTQGCLAINDEQMEWKSFGGRELLGTDDRRYSADAHLKNFLKNHTSFQSPPLSQLDSLVGSDRIVKGLAANPSVYRYFARLTYLEHGRLVYLCGGVLISDRFILTAAHCLWDMENGGRFPGGLRQNAFGAAVGYVCDYADNCGHNYVSYRATHYFVHPEWDPEKFVLDIGLVRLASPVPSEVATPARPDLGNYYRSLVYGYGNNIQSVGYGAINDASQVPRELQYLSLGYMPPEVCERFWGKLNNGVVCVYTNDPEEGLFGRGLCHGDSGSPAVIHQANGPDIVVGVTSFGQGLCTLKKFPDVLARVSAAAPYIANVVCYPGMSNVAPEWCQLMEWGTGAQPRVEIDAYDASSETSLGDGLSYFADETIDIVYPENKVGQDMVSCEENDDTLYTPNLDRPGEPRKCSSLKHEKSKKVKKRCTKLADVRFGTVSDAGRKCCNSCRPYQRKKRAPFTLVS